MYIFHKHTFRYPNKSNSTELLKFDWKSLDAGNQARVALTFETKSFTYQCCGKKYDLCFTEKWARLQANKDTTLNKRSEIYSKCRRTAKSKLRSSKPKYFRLNFNESYL